MARANYNQTNFTAGEISKHMYGRPDVDRYANALKEAYNALILPQGPITKCPGTRFVAEVKDSTKQTRLVSFTFNVTQTYILEFGDGYIRFFTNEGVLESSPGVPYEIVSPYVEADLFELKFTQTADILYIVHGSYPPKKLSRVSALSWTITNLDFLDGPFLPINTTTTTITNSAAGGIGTAVTLTASTAIFAATDVGRLVRHKTGGQWRSIKITSFSSTTVVSGTFQDVAPAGYTTAASSDWRLGEWSDTTGWPTVITFYQQRLFLFKNQNIYGSESGEFESFSPTQPDGTVIDSNGINYPIGSDQVNSIVWASAAKSICIGTVGGEWILRAGGSTANPEALTPTNVLATRETTYGSDEFIPIQRPGSNVVIFTDRTKRKLREFIYSFDVDGYVAPELTLLSRHITKSGVKDTAFAEGIEWLALENGRLVSLTYLRDQKVVGFCYHELGGTYDGGIAKVESVAAVDSSDAAYEQLWLIVRRDIDGTAVRYVEYQEKLFEPEDEDDKENAFFVSCGLTYDGSPVNTITGLDHLEGEEVDIFADGAVRPRKTVTGGSITLGSSNETKASVVQVGLPYSFRIKTLDPEIGGDAGTAQGKRKRCEKVKLRVVDTLGCKIGSSLDLLDEINFRNSDDEMDQSPPLVSDLITAEFEGDYEDELSIIVVSDTPTPITVVSILPSLVVYEQ